jgi:asparagine synthase (glutamine-hydrolysing)
LRLLQETRAFTRRLGRAAEVYQESDRRFDAAIALPLSVLTKCLLRRPPPFAGPYEIGVPPAQPGMRLRRQMAEAIQYNSLPMLLRYADRNAMAFGRETRFPFLDYDLVDWNLSLPDCAFVNKGWQKWILRRSAEGLLPRSIQWRADKVGYAAPLDVWLRGTLKEWAYERLFSSTIATIPGYAKSELEAMWKRHQQRHGNLSWPLWRWISLAEWLDLIGSGVWRDGVVK